MIGPYGLRSRKVAPLAGAWIEIETIKEEVVMAVVAPLAGAWIEIRKSASASSIATVAPLAGAWIEISKNAMCYPSFTRRSPCGSVD